MRNFIALFIGGLAAGSSAAVLKLFASVNGGTGFGAGEIKILPWIVFFIVFFSIKNVGQSNQTESDFSDPDDRTKDSSQNI